MPDCSESAAGLDAVTTSTLGALFEKYYQSGKEEQEKIIELFQAKPDAVLFSALESGVRDDQNARIRNAAMELYVALGVRSLPRLSALLHDSNEEVRTFAAVMLGTMNDRRAVPDLIQSLTDPDLNVKHAAAESLGRIRDERAVQPLIDVLTGDMWLQFPAAMALGDLGDSRAVPPLVALLEIPGSNMPAIQALGKIGDADAVVPLCKLLDDEDPSLQEWTLEAVVAILTRRPDAGTTVQLTIKTRAMLIEMLASAGPEAKRNAAITLGCCRVKEALSALSDFILDKDMGEVARKAILRINR